MRAHILVAAFVAALSFSSYAFAQEAGEEAETEAPNVRCTVYLPDAELRAARTRGRIASASNAWQATAAQETDGRKILGIQCAGGGLRLTEQVLDEIRLVQVVGETEREVEVAATLLTGIVPGEPSVGRGFSLLASIRPNVQLGLFNRRAASYRIVGGPFGAEGRDITDAEWQPSARQAGSVGVWASILDGDDDNLGAEIDAQWVMFQNVRAAGRSFSIAANAHGEIASDEEISTFSRSFKAGVTMTTFQLVGDTGVQIVLTPIEVEADQETEAVVGRAKVGVVARVPGTVALARAIGAGCAPAEDAPNCISAGMFVSLDAGVSYEIEAPTGVNVADSGTWGAEMWYQFPISSNWDLSLEASTRDDGGDAGAVSSYGVSLRYFLNCPRRAAFTISYIDGEFSPLGEQIEGVRMGLTTLLGNAGAPRAANPMRCSAE